jgi:hypothetical protein
VGGCIFPTPRPGVIDWSQYHGADTDYQEQQTWVSSFHHQPLLPMVNIDMEVEYAPLPLTDEQEL